MNLGVSEWIFSEFEPNAKQFSDGKRQARPTFVAAVVTTLGEYGQDMFSLQEFITSAFACKVAKEGERGDGRSKQQLTAEFRTRFRNATQIAVARGQAKMIAECGLSIASCGKYAAQAPA